MNVELPPEERGALLLAEMSLEEKMAQINCVFPFDMTYMDMDWISSQVPFGIGEVSTLEMRRMESLEEAAAWINHVQKIVMENSPHGIPAIFHMEGICGAFIQEAVSFPAGIARGAGFHPKLEEEIAECVAKQELACGITHILAPVLDISRDSRMGRQGEAYGEDPALVSAMGVAYTRGVQNVTAMGRRAHSVAKHFLAFHNSQGGIHGTHSETTRRTLREIYGKPFEAAVREGGLKGIMPCYSSIDHEPASVSRELLTHLLREEMGFDGICISDYGGIGNSHRVQHIGETIEETGIMALEAGMEIEMPSPAGYGRELYEALKEGKYDTGILDRAVHRILTVKFQMGLFEHPYAAEGGELRAIFAEAAKGGELSYQSAVESMVLLKNEGVLPLDISGGKIKKIAVIGPHADNARMLFGGYTHLSMMESIYAVANSIAGVAGIENRTGEEIPTVPGTNIQLDLGEVYDKILRRQKPGIKSVFEELKERGENLQFTHARGYHIAGADETLHAEALELIKDADLVLLTLGDKYGTCSLASMGEGIDSTHINLPPCQDSFIEKAAKLGKPLIGIHFSGRPISSDIADSRLDAILEAWAPAEAGARAIVDILTGVVSPSGRLPVSVAYNAGQIPVYYNHPWGSSSHQGESIGFANYLETPHKPRYCFGYGKSYAEFHYSNFRIEKKQLSPDEEIIVSCDVENNSERKADEIVQCYISDVYASRTRPVMELAGFQRIRLGGGCKKRVTFYIHPSQAAFLDKDMRWKIEKGELRLMIGKSSEEICFADSVYMTEDAWIEGKNRAFVAKTEVT